MKQYYAVKAKYPGALVLFRVGDFYETFGEDAIKSSSILGITLTKRGNGSATEIELAGFPHHSLDAYLPKLVRAGQRVAICDQLEDPKQAKGIVKRGVTELVTPGVSYNDHVLEVKRNNYLAAVALTKTEQHGIAFLDISTGEFLVAQGNILYIDKLLQTFAPSEVVFNRQQRNSFFEAFGEKFNTHGLDEWVFQTDFGYDALTQHFGTKNLKGFGIEELKDAIAAAGGILHYLKETEHKQIGHIASVSRIEEDRMVWLDKFTIRNLELIYPSAEGGIPLVQILDKTLTPMGGRLLRRWILMPLKDLAPIKERLSLVELFRNNELLQEQTQNLLNQVGDLERLISKVAARRIGPRDLVQLKRSITQVPALKQSLKAFTKELALQKIADLLHPCETLLQRLEQTLKLEVPALSNQGNIFQDGVSEELDELRSIAFSGKDHLLKITQREIERTGISSLKIQYNKVFGYYLEVTNVHKNKVPVDWIRKQTTVNAERYITEELKIYEDKILNAEDRLHVLEQHMFNELVEFTAGYIQQVQLNARLIAEIDCLRGFAEVSLKNQYCKPQVNDENVLHIEQGRHPVIEQQLPTGENYIPNDIYLDDRSQQIIIVTGPNMAGKSALLRQTALISLMAQMGSYVPAQSATIGIVDKVFTRVGASDNLSKGESTFMVEMTETASILNNLSERSLVLMDEIGRGTSTYDGISIAWSIVEFLHNHPKCKAKTLFATHYHELSELAQSCERVKNFNVSVKEIGNKIIFMRKLQPGGSEHSFGIHVAQIAGMPNQVLLRANEIMLSLEKEKIKDKNKAKLLEAPKAQYQLNMFEVNDPAFLKVRQLLEQTDINTLSPVEALLRLNELKNALGKS